MIKRLDEAAERPDEDSPELTRAMFRKARPAPEVLPKYIGERATAELMKSKGGRPPSDDPTVPVTLRLRRSVRRKYESAAGDKWRKLAEETLRDHAPGKG